MRSGSPVLGILLGAVLLAGLVGFAVGLPAASDAAGSGARSSGLPAAPFPDRLNGGALVAYDHLEPVEGVEVTPEQLAAAVQEQTAYAEERLSEFFGGEVAVASYTAPDLTAQAEVSAYDGPPGFFKPGLPSDPDAEHARPWFDAVRYGEVRCFVAWAADRQTEAAGGLPGAVQCQRSDAGRTYDIRATGIGVEETAAALNEVVAHARAG